MRLIQFILCISFLLACTDEIQIIPIRDVQDPKINGYQFFDIKWYAVDSTHYYLFRKPFREHGDMLVGTRIYAYKCHTNTTFYELNHWKESDTLRPYIYTKGKDLREHVILSINYISNDSLQLNNEWYSVNEVELINKCSK